MKNALKVIAFILIFVVIFDFFQGIFHYRWEEPYENCARFEKIPSVDVVFIGTSELQAGICPVAIYEETGITCYNLSHHLKSSPSFLYEVKYVIKKNHPKVIAMDFSTLFSDLGPDGTTNAFKQTLYVIPDKKIHYEFLMEVCRLLKKDSLPLVFPIMEYHSMWSTEEADFSKEYLYDYFLPDHKLGWYDYDGVMRDHKYDDEEFILSPKLWDYDKRVTKIWDYNKYYYDKIIELCREEGIQLIAVYPPKICDAAEKNSQIDTAMEYFTANGIPCFNYNTYEAVTEAQLDWIDDFYDPAHLNITGANKWSKMVGRDIMDSLALTDHRQENSDFVSVMNMWVDGYHALYDEYFY